MAFPLINLEDKPYNKCVTCEHIGKKCDGPNFLAMTTERWCEWCHLRKEYLGWTNANVADAADVSKVTVDRVLSGNVKDLRISTMQTITKALVNGSWGQYPCAAAEANTVIVDNPELVHNLEEAQKECERLNAIRHDDREKINFLKEQVSFKETQMAAKDKLISERYDFLKMKDKHIRILSIMLIAAVLFIIGALVIDRINPDIGFFWVSKLFPSGAGFVKEIGNLPFIRMC